MKRILTLVVAFSTVFCLNAFAGEWKQDKIGWWYQNDNGSYVKNEWKEINGKWYYFGEGGYMLSNTTTPDGYFVNESGEWIKPNDTSVASDIKYTINVVGKWVDDGKIPAGEYVFYPENRGDIIIKGSYSDASNFNYIKLYKGDDVNPGTYVPVSSAGQMDINKEGVFLVGKDIKAGTYTVTRIDPNNTRAECRVFNSISSSKDESSQNHNMEQRIFVFKVPREVTVKDGQYIQIIGCSANFVRP